MPTEACLEEFEALTAIFLDEISIEDEQGNTSSKVTMVLYPATGDDQESKYVTLTLELTLPTDYPKVPPLIRFRNPRGLSESLLDTLYRNMIQVCSERLESQMIFELIDMGKEFLTINNRPASECPICLLSFTSCDTFFRSQCFHHFHSYCLGRYLQNLMQIAASGDHLPGEAPTKTCPVCREKLDEEIDVQKLLGSPPPFEESLEVVDGDAILKEWHGQQEKLKTLFDKQKSQGGIIDLSEMDKKRLVISSPRATDSDSPSSSSDVSNGTDVEETIPSNSTTPAIATGGGNLPPVRNTRVEPPPPRNKVLQQKKPTERERPVTQNSQVKQQTTVPPKSGQKQQQQMQQQPQDPVPTGKASPTLDRHVSYGDQEGPRRRGKGGHYGNSRRRYK